MGFPPALGNQAVQRRLREGGQLLQRKCACGHQAAAGGECKDCRQRREDEAGSLHRVAARPTPAAGAAGAPPIVHQVLRAPGESLAPGLRRAMESRFGHDFTQVRVHTDGRAAASAHAVNALAYTVGRDVVFAAGRFEPSRPEGQRLLAHELAHTVQQRQAPPGWGELKVAPPDTALEREAEATARSIVEGPAAPLTLTPGRRQAARQPAPGAAPPTTASVQQGFPECLGMWGERGLTFLATAGASMLGTLVAGPGAGGIAGAAALARMQAQITPAADRVRRALGRQNFGDALCVFAGLGMAPMLQILAALGASDRAALRTNLALASASAAGRIGEALDAADLQAQAAPAINCQRASFTALERPDKAAIIDFLFPQGLPSPAGTFFGQRIPGNLVAGMRNRMVRAQAIAKRNLCLNGSDPNWQARETISTGGGGWHAKNQAFDLDLQANPYVMHEAGEPGLDAQLRPVYHRIAGLILLRDSIIPSDLATVRGGPGTQRTWRNGVAITTGELYDQLRAESDAMATYFGLLQAAQPLGPGAPAGAPNLTSPTTPDDFLARFQASAFGQAHTTLGLGATATALRLQIAKDYRTLGGSVAQLQAFAAQAAPNPAAPSGDRQGADRPFAGGAPAGTTVSPGGAIDPHSFRRPETGFLSIPREVVVALTEVELAWGAIDFFGESGDVMHFDCRQIGGRC